MATVVISCALPQGFHAVTHVSTTPIVAPADVATFVVIQPTTRQVITFIDGEGKILGRLYDRSHTVFTVPAGEISMYAVPSMGAEPNDNAPGVDAIRGRVEAGRIYYATMSIQMRGPRFNTLHSSSPDGRWLNRREWVANRPRTRLSEEDLVHVKAYLYDTNEIRREGDRYLDSLPPHQVEARTIRPEHGLLEH